MIFNHFKKFFLKEWTEFIVRYPNDTILQFGLANLLYGLIKKQKNADAEQEIHFLCNRILHSNKPDMQCGAKRILAFLSAQNGNMEEAMKYVNELPSIYCGREIVAEQILNGISFGKALKKWEAQMGD